MTNIMLNVYQIDAPWCFASFGKYIKPQHHVVVVALSYRNSRVKTAQDWDALYKKKTGKLYSGITGALTSYGIMEENIEYIGDFYDTPESAKAKVQGADILYFLGGMPDQMYDRIRDLGLIHGMKAFRGVVIGYSAGAVIQLSEYFLSPDEDYHEYGCYYGIGYINDFGIEVHYDGSPTQTDSIKRYISEWQKPVYAITDAGAVIVSDGNIETIGEVKLFYP